jgi:hypothetical protein
MEGFIGRFPIQLDRHLIPPAPRAKQAAGRRRSDRSKAALQIFGRSIEGLRITSLEPRGRKMFDPVYVDPVAAAE